MLGEEADEDDAAEKDAAFDLLGDVVEALEVEAGGVGDVGLLDDAAGLCAVAFHGGEDAELRPGGGGEHGEGKERGGERRSAEVGAFGKPEKDGADEDERCGDEADGVKDADGGGDDEAGFVSRG